LPSEDTVPMIPIEGDEELNDPLRERPMRTIAAPVGAVAARGFYWLTALSLLSKVIGTISQIVLSWFITRKDFGLIGTSTTIASFIWLINDAGLSQIMVKRQRRFALWATPTFWLSIVLGIIAAILTALSGLVAWRITHQKALLGLMLILAIRGLVAAPSAVPVAELNKDMRFRLLALMGIVFLLLERSLMILLTSPWVRWGAYGFVITVTMVTAMRTAAMWWYARSPVKMQAQFRRWKYIYRDSWLLMMAQGFQTISTYGDNMLLAIFRSQEIVGDYYWAYNFSLQTVTFLTVNLANVLFPALSKLQREPERMRQGFIRAALLLTTFGIPCCLLQAAVARPMVIFVFGTRWQTAIPALQVLSLGMAFALVNYPAVGLLRAQGRFDMERKISGICAGLFLIVAFFGAYCGGSLSMAIAVAIYNVVAGVLFLRCAMGPDWRAIAAIFVKPLVPSVLAIGLAYLLSWHMSAVDRVGCLKQVVVVTALGGVGYAIAARIMIPEAWKEGMVHLRPIWRHMGRLVGR
jgi:O-antigen/teichoic acid export membrane protein